MSPGPSVAVWVPQQQALMAGQHMGVVVLHHAAHTGKQNLTFQVELRILFKDAIIPHFVRRFIPHDQNLQGGKYGAGALKEAVGLVSKA